MLAYQLSVITDKFCSMFYVLRFVCVMARGVLDIATVSLHTTSPSFYILFYYHFCLPRDVSYHFLRRFLQGCVCILRV